MTLTASPEQPPPAAGAAEADGARTGGARTDGAAEAHDPTTPGVA